VILLVYPLSDAGARQGGMPRRAVVRRSGRRRFCYSAKWRSPFATKHEPMPPQSIVRTWAAPHSAVGAQARTGAGGALGQSRACPEAHRRACPGEVPARCAPGRRPALSDYAGPSRAAQCLNSSPFAEIRAIRGQVVRHTNPAAIHQGAWLPLSRMVSHPLAAGTDGERGRRLMPISATSRKLGTCRSRPEHDRIVAIRAARVVLLPVVLVVFVTTGFDA